MFRTQSVFHNSLFLWTFKMQFWQPCKTFTSERPKMSCSISTVQSRKVILKNWLTSNSSSQHVDGSFDNPKKILTTKSQKSVSQCLKMMKKTNHSKKTYLPQDIPPDSLNTVFATRPTSFQQTDCRKAWVVRRKRLKLEVSFGSTFLPTRSGAWLIAP